MGLEFRHMLETKRLVWLVAVVFAVVIMFQYLEFPYGDVGSTLFSANKARIPVNISHPPEASPLIPTGVFNNFSVSNVAMPPRGLDNVDSRNDFEDYGESTEQRVHAMFLGPGPGPATAPVMTPGILLEPRRNPAPSVNESYVNGVKESHERPMGEVITISEMRDILSRNRASSRSMKPRWSSKVDQELLHAKSEIENAPIHENDPMLSPSLYRNVSRFKRSYELMEKTLKVYVYKEGEKPIFHQPQAVLKGIYASEGWFMKHMKSSKRFVTKKPKQAHLFYLPFSSRMLEETLYVPGSHSHDNMIKCLKDYLDLIVGRYNFWNRTGGSDHFLVACHDWAAAETRKHLNTCIRALCVSDVKREGFVLGKDVALPETFVRSAQNPLRESGGKPPSHRPILAFFAGQMHGYVRPILLQHWQDKDPDIKIFGKLPKSKNNRNYIQYMKSSKYCICAKGYEVNSPRVVEAIFYECVPVIISDNFVPPFFEVLNWEVFAVFVLEREIPNLKEILRSIPESKYLEMQKRVKEVKQHFLWHVKPEKYDLFHMILHSIWYNRVFRVNPR